MGTEIGHLVLQTLFSLLLLAIVLRLLLQAVRADYYNPISQFLVKVTNPLVLPLRRLIPSIGRLDLSALLLLVVVQAVAIAAILTLYGVGVPPVAQLLAWALIACAGLVLNLYFFAILINIILSWVAPGTGHPAAILLYQLCEPVQRPFRSILPAMGGLDLSPILVFLAINVLQVVVRHMATGVGMPRGVAFGF